MRCLWLCLRCRIWVSALAPSDPFICTRSLIRPRPRMLSFPLSCPGALEREPGHMVKGHETLHPSPEPVVSHFSYQMRWMGIPPRHEGQQAWCDLRVAWSLSLQNRMAGCNLPIGHGACEILIPKPCRDTIWTVSVVLSLDHGRVSSSSAMAEMTALPGAV